MAITTAEREELHELVQQHLGTRGADLLMAGLATADLEAMEERLTLRIELVRAELRTETGELSGQFHELGGEFGELRGEFGELRGDFGELRGEFGELRGEFGELRGEFGELRGEVGAEIGRVRGELGEFRGEVRREFGKVHEEFGRIRGEMATQNRVLVFATVTAGIGVVSIVLGLAGLVFTAVQLAGA